jgi:hypothetical protein
MRVTEEDTDDPDGIAVSVNPCWKFRFLVHQPVISHDW